jgi:hypothetical protein
MLTKGGGCRIGDVDGTVVYWNGITSVVSACSDHSKGGWGYDKDMKQLMCEEFRVSVQQELDLKLQISGREKPALVIKMGEKGTPGSPRAFSTIDRSRKVERVGIDRERGRGSRDRKSCWVKDEAC